MADRLTVAVISPVFDTVATSMSELLQVSEGLAMTAELASRATATACVVRVRSRVASGAETSSDATVETGSGSVPESSLQPAVTSTDSNRMPGKTLLDR